MASTEFATRSHKGAGFLFFLGFGLLAAGAAFALAPHFSWQVVKIARQASGLGLESGVLVVGGLVVIGLGVVARVASSAAPSLPDTRAESEALQSELHLLNEQTSTKLAQLRTSLLQIHESVKAVADQQQAFLQEQGEKVVQGDHSQDAVFRLAASLDKLHAHLDERVHAVDLQLRSGFEALLHASNDLRHHLAQGAFAAAPGGSASMHPAHAPAPPPGGGIDFFETMQKLDAIAGGGAVEAQGRQPQAPFPSQGHGESLDAFLPEEYRDRY